MKNGNGHLKLNIGSGDMVTVEGYVNVDAKFGGIAYPLGYGGGTVDEIYASHILEHFGQYETLNVLRDWVRALKPGAWLKIAVPDFDWIVKQYVSGNPNGYPLAGYLMGGQTDANDYHKAIFNEPDLRRMLIDAGLTDIQAWTSDVKDCASLPVSLNLMGFKPYVCPNCGATDGKLLEDACYHCHPTREQLQEGWDERVSAFLKHSRGLIRFGANDGAQRDVYGQYGIPVIWVEALPDVCVRLAENVSTYPNHRALNYLLTDEDGREYDFGVASNEGKSSSIFPFGDHTKIWPTIGYTHSIKLKSATFKTMVEAEKIDLSSYDSLVMDLQGSELKALKGMGDLIDGFNWILAEASDFEIYEGCCQLKDLDKYLLRRGFVRAETFKAIGMRGVGHVYDVLYERKDRKALNGDAKHYVAGAWREESTLIKEQVKVKTGIVMSTPRYGSLDSAECIFEIAAGIGAPRFKTTGAWRYQGRARSTENVIGFGSEGKREWEEELTEALDKAIESGIDIIITADYDTFATADEAKALIRLLYENPQYDCIVPTQIRRGTFEEMLATFAGQPDLSQPLVPILTGHFGLTVFRRSVFEKLSRPWFLPIPDTDGRWGPGRTDADIYFWNKFAQEGFKAALATNVVIGHGDEVVTWPKFENGKVTKVFQPLYAWHATRKAPVIVEPS